MFDIQMKLEQSWVTQYQSCGCLFSKLAIHWGRLGRKMAWSTLHKSDHKYHSVIYIESCHIDGFRRSYHLAQTLFSCQASQSKKTHKTDRQVYFVCKPCQTWKHQVSHKCELACTFISKAATYLLQDCDWRFHCRKFTSNFIICFRFFWTSNLLMTKEVRKTIKKLFVRTLTNLSHWRIPQV